MSQTHFPARTALLIIDMQDAYFKTPRLQAHKPTLLEAINHAVSRALSQDWYIFNVRTVHERDTSTWTRNMRSDAQGFAFEGDAETKPIVDLQCAPRAIDITKTRDSAFHDTRLLEELLQLGVTDIILSGVATHSCIFHTAADAYANDFSVYLYGPGIADEDEALASQALSYLKQEYRQAVVRSL